MNKKSGSLILLLAAACSAETWTVTTVLDTVDPADGVLSLREAILAANANLDSEGRCRGRNDIVFRLPATNAVATHGTTSVSYYKIKINYPDPEYARVKNFSPRPATLPHVRCPIYLDGYSQPGVSPGSPLIEISGEDLPLAFDPTGEAQRGEDVERTTELLTLDGRLARQPADGPTIIGCRPADPGCPLRRSASGSTIRGLMFNYAPQTGLALFGADEVTITGNYFGLDATGENPAPNGRRVEDFSLFSLLLNGASRNTVGTPAEPNYFGVARSHSMMLWPLTGSGECGPTSPANRACSRFDIGSSENTIRSNYFGLNKRGTRTLGAICIHAPADRRFVGERNCEEGRTRTDAIYTNGGPHIFVNFYPGDGHVSRNSMRRNRIGGSQPGEGNVFAAAWSGVQLRAVETEVIGNIFGLTADGLSAAEIGPFFRMGVILGTDATSTLVQGNFIANSANFQNFNAPTIYGYGGGVLALGGVGMQGYSDDLAPNIVRENFIGVNTEMRHPGKNLIGLPASNAGGGVTTTWMVPLIVERNLIAYNGYLGAAAISARTTVVGANTPNEQSLPPRRLVVLGNAMYCNGAPAEGGDCGAGVGIDWSASRTNLPAPAIGDGPTLNDDGDLDDGPAELQNYPVLAAAPGGVTGRLASKPNTRYRIQLFSSPAESAQCAAVTTTLQPGFEPDAACASATGGPAFLAVQGETLIRELEVTTGPDGVAQFSAAAPANRMVTATATELSAAGRPLCTSELSQAVMVRQP